MRIISITPNIVEDFKSKYPCSNIPLNNGMLITYDKDTGDLLDYELYEDFWCDTPIPHDNLVDAGEALSALISQVWEVANSDDDAIAKWHYWIIGELSDASLFTPQLSTLIDAQ